ncbi:MAG: tyrosine-type recombinase/integrase [Proteobacteria bacterium]|nr:tyrosine-type recombinase/integrase [Pseudomonadota bacterium]
MKLTLNQGLVYKLSSKERPVPGSTPLEWESNSEPNYLVFDEHKDAPPGFAVRVGKKAAVYLVDRLVAGKKLKIAVGLATGRKGGEKPISLSQARGMAWDLIKIAKFHGTNPKNVADQIDAAELTLGEIWNKYEEHLRNRAQPAKQNSLDSLEKAREKLKDWEDRKVRFIKGEEVVERFDLHAITKGHRTAAEAMGRWATSAVAHAIDREVHDAHAAKRAPSLTYNPFTILRTEEKYRKRAQLEREYAAKGVRNPLSFSSGVGPYVKAAWAYRKENPVAADFILLTLLWGMRRGESATFQWLDRMTNPKDPNRRSIDLEHRVAYVGDAKNRGDHEFPIGPCSTQLLKLRRDDQLDDEVWVFPARSPKSEKGYYSSPSEAMNTVKKNAKVAVLRGHDLRRTFGAACEKLGLADRQIKRMLGHAVAGAESLGRYTSPEWKDLTERMERVEELILSKAPSVYNALRPRSSARMQDAEDIVVAATAKRPPRRKPR